MSKAILYSYPIYMFWWKFEIIVTGQLHRPRRMLQHYGRWSRLYTFIHNMHALANTDTTYGRMGMGEMRPGDITTFKHYWPHFAGPARRGFITYPQIWLTAIISQIRYFKIKFSRLTSDYCRIIKISQKVAEGISSQIWQLSNRTKLWCPNCGGTEKYFK